MSKQRNYGIDLLRVISMCMIIMLHFLGHGGVLNSVEDGTANYWVAWLLETIAYSGVAMFASISGYVGWKPQKEDNRNRAVGFILLWMQVAFYSLIISAATWLFHHEIGITGILKGIFPIATDTYWYFTAYFLLFLLMPLLNHLIDKVDCDSVWILIISFAIFMYFAHTLTGLFGLSVLMLCYVSGGILNKFHVADKISKQKIGGVIIALIILTWLWKVYVSKFNATVGSMLLRYDSPTIICIALGSVLFFSKICVKESCKRPIKFFASSAFAAYLLNDHPYIREYLISDAFRWLSSRPFSLVIAVIVCASLLFVVAAILVDKLRLVLFKLINCPKFAIWINKEYQYVSIAIGRFISNISRRFLSDNNNK